MRLGSVLAGRFRLQRELPPRADRTLFAAVDEVSKQMVTVQVGTRVLAAEAEVARFSAGRGTLPVLGLWRDGRDVLLVCRRREPVLRVSDCTGVSPTRAVAWLADVADALDRLHRAGQAHGGLCLDRVSILGGSAYVDVTGPWVPGASRSDDVQFLAELLHATVDPAALTWRDRGIRGLLGQLPTASPADLPVTAGTVRVAAERVVARRTRRPGRLQSVALVPRASSVVLARTAQDDQWTHASAPMSLRRARRLAVRAAAAGWVTTVSRRGLALGDLMWMVVGALLCGVLLPIAGLLVGGVWMARRRAARCRPGVGRDLALLPEDLSPGTPSIPNSEGDQGPGA